MTIGGIGASRIGTALPKRLAPKGHGVMPSFTRDSRRLKACAAAFGARSRTPALAAAYGDLDALATP